MNLKSHIAITCLFLACRGATAQAKPDVIQDSLSKTVTVEVRGFVDDYETDASTYTIKMPVTYLGSGAFISPDGFVLSCDHLFYHKMDNRQIIVKTGTGKKYRALLLDEDWKKDLGLLKIFPLHPVKYFVLGKSAVRGQKVFAFGSPLDLDKTVSVGYVENLQIGKDKRTLHSAAINPGSSGGPLVTEDGQLVGVNVSFLLANIFMRAEGMQQAVNLHDIRLFLKD